MHQKNVHINNLTIIVSSCDKYSDFWSPFFTLLWRYWPSLKSYNTPVPIILVTDQKDIKLDRVATHRGGKHTTWSQNLKGALSKVTTPYVLYLQEDYLFCREVNEGLIHTLLEKMTTHRIPYIQIAEDVHGHAAPYNEIGLPHLFKKDQHNTYLACLNAALWRTEVLKSLLNDSESAWDFEHCASERARHTYHPFLYINKNFPVLYINACYRGFVLKDALSFLKQEKIPFTHHLPIEYRNIESWKYPETSDFLRQRGVFIQKEPTHLSRIDRLFFNLKRAFYNTFYKIKSFSPF